MEAKRIAILGSGGAGKSTFARELAKKLDYPLYHLDWFYWKPGWKITPHEEWKPVHDRLISGERWIIDGNYMKVLEDRLDVADTVFYFDLPRRTCLWRAFWRRFDKLRPDMAPGCYERWDTDFFKWIWNFPQKERTTIIKYLEARRDRLNIYMIHKQADLQSFLESL